jgi:hypothetical protein
MHSLEALTLPSAHRFGDDRGQYENFTIACDEKELVARRIAQELSKLQLKGGFKVFEAGGGNFSFMEYLLNEVAQNPVLQPRFKHLPFLIVAKEISGRDIAQTLQRLPGLLERHPATVFAFSNLLYSSAPRLWPKNGDPIWGEYKLTGHTAGEFKQQIDGGDLGSFPDTHWNAIERPSGGLVAETPAVLVIYREDQHDFLRDVIPQKGGISAEYDLVNALHVYRRQGKLSAKAKLVASLAEAVGPGGLITLTQPHSQSSDADEQVMRKIWQHNSSIWPEYDSRHDDIHNIIGAARELTTMPHQLTFSSELLAYNLRSDCMQLTGAPSLPELMWDVAAYVAQIPRGRHDGAVGGGHHLTAAGEVLDEYRRQGKRPGFHDDFCMGWRSHSHQPKVT